MGRNLDPEPFFLLARRQFRVQAFNFAHGRQCDIGSFPRLVTIHGSFKPNEVVRTLGRRLQGACRGDYLWATDWCQELLSDHEVVMPSQGIVRCCLAAAACEHATAPIDGHLGVLSSDERDTEGVMCSDPLIALIEPPGVSPQASLSPQDSDL